MTIQTTSEKVILVNRDNEKIVEISRQFLNEVNNLILGKQFNGKVYGSESKGLSIYLNGEKVSITLEQKQVIYILTETLYLYDIEFNGQMLSKSDIDAKIDSGSPYIMASSFVILSYAMDNAKKEIEIEIINENNMDALTIPTQAEAEQVFGEVCAGLLDHFKSPHFDYTGYGVVEDKRLGIHWAHTLKKLTPLFAVLPKEIVNKIGYVNMFMVNSGLDYLPISQKFHFGLFDATANFASK
ncbi:hypothetical protein [Adhaeribacter arboris]|nr:hypothetical protein [Adhaeribacter arboris]